MTEKRKYHDHCDHDCCGDTFVGTMDSVQFWSDGPRPVTYDVTLMRPRYGELQIRDVCLRFGDEGPEYLSFPLYAVADIALRAKRTGERHYYLDAWNLMAAQGLVDRSLLRYCLGDRFCFAAQQRKLEKEMKRWRSKTECGRRASTRP